MLLINKRYQNRAMHNLFTRFATTLLLNYPRKYEKSYIFNYTLTFKYLRLQKKNYNPIFF